MEQPSETVSKTQAPGIVPAAITALIAFVVVPLVSCIFAFPLFQFSKTAEWPFITAYYLLGGHGVTLAIIWTGFKRLSNHARGSETLLALVYLGTAGICWLLVAIGIVSWT